MLTGPLVVAQAVVAVVQQIIQVLLGKRVPVITAGTVEEVQDQAETQAGRRAAQAPTPVVQVAMERLKTLNAQVRVAPDRVPVVVALVEPTTTTVVVVLADI